VTSESVTIVTNLVILRGTVQNLVRLDLFRGLTIDELAETVKGLLQGEKKGKDFPESQA
jgi:hypothetical protein